MLSASATAVQSQVHLHLTLSGGAGRGAHGLGGGAHHRQVVLHASCPGLDRRMAEVLHQLVQLNLHHGIGDVSLHVAHQLLDNSVLKLLLGGLASLSSSLSPRLFLNSSSVSNSDTSLANSSSTTGAWCSLTSLTFTLKTTALPARSGVIVLGEGDVQLLLVAGLHAHDLLLKAGDKGAGAQLQAVVLALAAFEGHAVVKALEVDDGGVPVLGLPVHADQAGGAVDVGLELALNVLVGDLRPQPWGR